MLRLVANLRVGEAQRRVPRSEMILVATTIARLLGGSAVVAQAIGLDNQPQVGPEEVDAKAAEVLARERHRKPCLLRERQEEPLELGIGEPKRAPVKQLPQPRNAPATPIPLELRAESLRINKIEPIRLIHRPLEPSTIKSRGDVNQGQDWIRHGNADMTDDVSGEQLWSAMDLHFGLAMIGRGPNRNLDRSKAARLDTPKRRSAAVGQKGGISTGENCRHPSSMDIDLTPTNGVDPMPHRIQPASIDPMLNRTATQPKPQELPPLHNPMLLPRKLPNRSGRLLS